MTIIQLLIVGLFLVGSSPMSDAGTLTSLSKGEELKRLSQLKQQVEDVFFNDPIKTFYNYSIICGGKDYESRGDRTWVDKTVPQRFSKLVHDTFSLPDTRLNKCPKWTSNVETRPKSGSMDVLSISEKTRVGDKVYLLLAMDPEQEPLYYFIRKAEAEVQENPNESVDETIFRVNVVKMGLSWVGEVILNKKLDYESKSSYSYLTYAFDGANLLEKYSLVEVLDVDDETPVIEKSSNSAWNAKTKQFEFTAYENASVGEIINAGRLINFTDVDTQHSQLTVRLVNLDSGMTDSPFTLNNLGELRLTNKLDYELNKHYEIKINVQDAGGQFAEELIRIDVLDVPDLPPRFVLPQIAQDPKFNLPVFVQSLNFVEFYENTLGKVFVVRAVSQNREPLGNITYQIDRIQAKKYEDYFKLRFNETTSGWYLDCVKKIDLDDRDVDVIEVTIRAIEAPSGLAKGTGPKLLTDMRINLKIVNGDLCSPKFDKSVYEFKVQEGIRDLLEPIQVEDCDHGVNGRIFLRSMNPNFAFKIDQVYRFSKIAIEMQRAYDYEDESLTLENHTIEFDIVAQSSNQSVNRYETRARVIVRIFDLNEFAPKFIRPQPAHILRDGHPTAQMQQIFTYNVPENTNFTLEVQAIDPDSDGSGKVFYNTRYLHPEDSFQIIDHADYPNNLYKVTIPGMYLDSNAQIPIAFSVYAEDVGEPKLRNEIIIYLRPQSLKPKPAYFLFERYEYQMKENDPKPKPYELRVVNDNLATTKVEIVEVQDPLGLLSVVYEENLVTEGDIVSFPQVNSEKNSQQFSEFANDILVYLYPTNPRRDLDEFFILNNRSDVYEYKLKTFIKDQPELVSEVTVLIKLIDDNDNKPRVIDESPSGVTIMDATISEDFIPDSLLNINSNYTIMKFTDGDFTPEFGLPSLYCTLNDTRFYIDADHMLQELAAAVDDDQDNGESKRTIEHISVPIRVFSSAKISRRDEPYIWLNISCEDNFFARKLNPKFNRNSPLIVRIRVLEPAESLASFTKSTGYEWFDREQFVFAVDEDFTGIVGEMATAINEAAVALNLKSDYKIESEDKRLVEKLRVNSDSELEIIKGFDYEHGEKVFNFTVAVQLIDAKLPSKSVVFKTQVTLIINDLNDERPRFTQTRYEFVVNANKPSKLPINTMFEVGSIFAIDLDKQDQSKLKFTLNGNDASRFELVARDFGECAIEMPSELLRDKSEFDFSVTVTDLSGHTAETEVRVRVESRPLFDELKWSQEEAYSSSIKENSPPNTQVIGVNVEPVGIVSGAKFTIGYKLSEPNPYYDIEENSGIIQTSSNGPALDREETDAYKQIQQTRLYVQAFMDMDKVRYWSNIKQVNVEIIDENDERPKFVNPSDNETHVLVDIDKTSSSHLFNFTAIDMDLNDRVTYSLIEQRLVYSNGSLLSLPFNLNQRNGTLGFSADDLTENDFRVLIKHGANIAKIRLTVRAVDKTSKSSTCILFVELPIGKLIKSAAEKAKNKANLSSSSSVESPIFDKEIPIAYDLHPKVRSLEKLSDRVYSIAENTSTDTPIADVRIFLRGEENEDKDKMDTKPELFNNLRLVASPNEPSYFSYDATNFTLKLIRPLDYDLVKNLTVQLASGIGNDPSDMTSASAAANSQFNLTLHFEVRDVNNKPPELALDAEEKNKYGSNLLIVVVDDLSDMIEQTAEAISSTPLPPRAPIPAIPEMDLPERIPPHPPYRTPELDARRQGLKEFNQRMIVRNYSIVDPDLKNSFSVTVLNGTDSNSNPIPIVTKIDGNSLVFEKNGHPVVSRSVLNLELNDGINRKNYTGEIIPIFAKQLQRLFTYLPNNGRFRGEIYRSSVGSVAIDLNPMIQIENQFPYDINLNLTGTYAKYFQITPRIVKSSPINISPTQVYLSLKESLDKNADEFNYVTFIELDCLMLTENEYINELLAILGPIKIKLEVKSENKHKPEIIGYDPASGRINLDEGTYFKEEIASIQGFDRDKFDPGRLEYQLIGDNKILTINATTGVVYLSGNLDAEADQPHVFFCFARDMAPKPFGMSSNLIRFELYVNDINEFTPVLMPAITSTTIVEPLFDPLLPTHEEIMVNEFRFDCSDRDINASLSITLDSVRYVSKHDLEVFLNPAVDNNTYDLKSLFKLVYSNSTIGDFRSSYLAYSSRLDYEKLFKPTETFIRLDVSCSDGEFNAKSKVFIEVKDRNDNPPIFSSKTLVVTRNEASTLQSLVQIEASDADLSPEFGNKSLEYSLVRCEPNLYDMYIDPRTGQLSSRLVIDLDTDEIIRQRKNMFRKSKQTMQQVLSQINFLSTFNRIICDIKVADNRLYSSTTTNTSVSWEDQMKLEIVIDSVNDNAPQIILDQEDNLIEIREGEETRGKILLKIPVFDKDDATGLVCLFGNGLSISDPFELKTIPQDPHTTVCLLKVRDDMIVDYDVMRKSFYLLELVVRDMIPLPVLPNIGETSSQIRIRVIPVNNRPPLFVNGEAETIYVLDSIRPGTLIGTVLATDMENPNPDRLIYALDMPLIESVGSGVDEKFELKSSTNTTPTYWGSAGLFVKSKLDVADSPYLIPVVVYDGPPELSDTLMNRKTFTVVVLNKGSMSVWTNSTTGVPVDYYSVTLDEEVRADTFVCQVHANIPDNYQTASKSSSSSLKLNRNDIEYSLVLDTDDTQMDVNKYYEIDRFNGKIVTTGERIDYEQEEIRRAARSLRVRAQTSDKFFTYFTHVTIDIQDVNDNAPKFDKDVSTLFNVVENTTLADDRGAVIGRVRATDADSEFNAQFKYHMITNTTLFAIDERSGEILCLDGLKIDRETTPFYSLEVAAIDTGDLNSTLEITIAVLDINDNAPQFDPETQLEHRIEENKPNWQVTLNARDLDAGTNGSVLFYIDPALNQIDTIQKFRIDPMTGLFELIAPLDYEVKHEYRVVVTAMDQGVPSQLKTSVEIVVEVVDLNDNAPKFTPDNEQLVHVIETITPERIITRVRALDADISEAFNQVNYELIADPDTLNQLFTVDSVSGEVRLAHGHRLNADVQNQYRLEIVAFDANKTEFRDQWNLTVVVEPSMDKLPIFEIVPKHPLTLFKRSLRDSSAENDYVVEVVRAVDPNKRGIKYSLDSVEVVDGHEINNATLSTPADPGLFSIGEEDGAIKAKRRGIAYTAHVYRLVVRATSKLNDSLSTTIPLFVNVDRMTDSLFEKRVYEKSIDENSPLGMMVVQLRPRVKALGDLSLRYEINKDLSSPFSDWFKIDSHNGRIETASRTIDAEKTDEVLLNINITDWRTSSHLESILVKIKIDDVDDNLPVFEPNYNYEVSIKEDNSSTKDRERFITRFRASDLDRTPRFSEINYHLDAVSSRALSTESFRLFVDDDTQEVSLFKLSGVELDRDDPAIGNTIKVTVMAENPYDKKRYTRKVILITLIDVNDNAPRIMDSNTEISLSEDARLNQAFYHVKAVDADAPNTPNSELVYQLRPRSNNVQIDTNGYLSLIAPLDYESQREIEINVEVLDKSSEPLTTSRKYIIKVLNVNDNPPQFVGFDQEGRSSGTKDDCEFSVYEDVDVGYTVHKFNVIDMDLANSTDFLFSLKGAANLPFSIDSNTGELSTTAPLDRETVAEYKSVTVSVRDPEINGKRLETNTSCRIVVLDVNDNKPAFAKVSNDFRILPIVGERTLIGVFSASDIDLGNNATIDYYLLNDYDRLFEVDLTGHIYLNLRQKHAESNEDDEDGNSDSDDKKNIPLLDFYELTLMARDRGTPQPRESSLPVMVKIDPNYFTFNQARNEKLEFRELDTILLNENEKAGTFVTQVQVLNSLQSIMDDSSSPASSTAGLANRNVSLTFELLTSQDTFKIDSRTGRIEVLDSRKLDYEQVKMFIVSVKAEELQEMATFKRTRTGQTKFIVKLMNINDCPVQFNRDQYITRIKESDPKQSVPFDIGLDPLIEISDPDLDSEAISKGLLASNQLNPVEIHLSGPDASTFRLVRVSSARSLSASSPLNNIGVYKVESIERFDYELRSSYEFNVSAYDGVFRTSVRVLVSILDVNDNRPIFERSDYTFRIDENAPQHTEVGRVRAVDLDATEENNFTLYKITSNLEMSVFGINERTGVIFVRDPSRLDREKTPTFNMTIVAYNPDFPDLFDTARVLVHLNDLNDETPRFDRPMYSISIREKWKKLPRLLARLHATDLDWAENGTVNYFIESINGRPANRPHPAFYIDKVNGFFYLNAYLDADVDHSSGTDITAKSFEIRVVAQDMGGLRDKATVTITLIDVNDHPPVVIMPKVTEFAQDENSPSNTTLVSVRCIDPDYKQVHVTYELERDLNKDFESFSLDSYHGVLSNAIEFDYEEKNEYRVRINCVDTGVMINFDDLEANVIDFTGGQVVNDLDHSYTHTLITKLDLVIKVNDLDDNEPEFSEFDRHLSKNISEYLEPNSTVAILPIARDRDTLPQNTQVRYVLLPDDGPNGDFVLNKFSLNDTSGELTLRDELESNERSFYELRIKATSLHRPTPSVLRANDSDPSQLTLHLFVVKDRLTIEFEQQNYFVTVKTDKVAVAAVTEIPSIGEEESEVEISHGHKMVDLDKRTTRSVVLDESVLPPGRDKSNTAVFFSRAHLIKRKIKRTLKFNIEMAKVIRFNSNAIMKLSTSSFKKITASNGGASFTDADHLFSIDEDTGKVYISRRALKEAQYGPGDRLLLTIVAESRPTNAIIDSVGDDLIENAVCQLSIRLTDRDYTLVLPMSARMPIDRIYQEYLNPLKTSYLPREFEADGVRIAVQDLIEKQSRTHQYYMLVQVESGNGMKPVDLDAFAELWKNYSSGSGNGRFLGEVVERETRAEFEPRQSEGSRDDMPFYLNWLFWLLVLIGVLLFAILVLFVFCIKITKKQRKDDDKPGIIIEYPPGINPMYNDGILSLNPNKSTSRPTKRKAPTIVPVEVGDEPEIVRSRFVENRRETFEEQEAELVVDDDDDDTNE